MNQSLRYVLAAQLSDPDHFRAVFGSAVVQIAHADITRGIEQYGLPKPAREIFSL